VAAPVPSITPLPFEVHLGRKVSVRLTSGDAALLDRLSTEHDATRSAVMRAALTRGLVHLREELSSADPQPQA